MKTLPLITIIIPVYKVEEYIHKCVNSVLNQTYNNLEIFLVDDGSPDNCGEICEDYSKKDHRIKVIHKNNGGLSDARNVAIDIANGEYITFVDSDDYVSKDYIEVLYELIEKYQCKISVSAFLKFKEDYQFIDKNEIIKENLFSCEDAIKEMFYQRKFDTSAWAKLYHKSLFSDGIRYPKGLLYEDLATTYKLFLKSDKIAFSNKKTYFYLIRSNSIEGSSFSPKKIESTIKIINQLESDFYSLPQYKKSLHARIVGFCFHILVSMPMIYKDRFILISKIKVYRAGIIFDNRSKLKTRITLLLTFFGINNLIKLLKKI